MKSLTDPFDLASSRRKLAIDLDWICLIDLIAIFGLFAMLSSRFVFAPGVAVQLPRIQGSAITGQPAAAVLTVASNNLIVFEQERHDLVSLKEVLNTFMSEHPQGSASLLVKVDMGVTMQTFAQIAEIAQAAGFETVQIAAIPNERPLREYSFD